MLAHFEEDSADTLTQDVVDRAEINEREHLIEAAQTSEEISTEGSATVTADSVELVNSMSLSGGNVFNDEVFDVAVEGTDGDYTVDVTEQRVLSDWQVDRWDTEASATDTIENSFSHYETELGATVVVQVNHHSFDETTNELDIEYTVDIVGIEQDSLAELLAEDEGLTSAQADSVADAVLGVNVNTLSMSITADATANSIETVWTVDIQNVEPVAQTTFDIAEAEADNDAEIEMIQEARDRFDSASATDYTHLATWDLAFSASSDTATVEATVSYDTENRAAYVDDLIASGVVDDVPEVEFEVVSELTTDDNVHVTASVTAENEDLVDNALDAAIASIRADDTADDDAADLFEMVQSADLETARMDVSVSDGHSTIEAGGQFEDVSEFSDSLGDGLGDGTVSHLYGKFDQTEETGTVYIDDLIDEDITEDAVRDTPTVGDDTTVYLPDDWNEDDTELPRFDLQQAADFLDTDVDDDIEDTPDEPTDETTVSLNPNEQTVTAGDNVTHEIVVTDLDNGLSSYNVTVTLPDTESATITGASVERESGFGDEVISEDGSSVDLERALGDDTYEATDEIVLGEVTIDIAEDAGSGPVEDAAETVEVTFEDTLLGDLDNEAYDSTTEPATLEVVTELPAPDLTGNGQPATDTTGDGKLNDLDGSGEFSINDVQIFFENLDSEAIQENQEQFDFAEDDSVGIGDVQVLFEQL